MNFKPVQAGIGEIPAYPYIYINALQGNNLFF